jgi:5-methylcytosine-specific restriction endonuclease McrA
LPSGDSAAIVEHALEVLHAELLKQKAAQVAKPRRGSSVAEAKGRYIPAAIKREVWRRDQGRCAFVGAEGRKCESTDGVEFHHVQPFATGGEATVKNIEMRCRSHNGFEWTRHLDQETAALVEL